MDAPLVALYALTSLAYLALTVIYVIQFMQAEARFTRWTWPSRAATIAVHAAFLTLLGIRYRELPLVSPFNMLSILALSVAVVHMAVEARFRTRETGVFFYGAALVLQVLSWPSLHLTPQPSPLLQHAGFGLHVGAAILGYVGFIVSALYGVMYLAQYRALKRKTFGRVFNKLPPLDLLSEMNLYAAWIGFCFMTVALALGGILVHLLSQEIHRNILLDPKFIQSMAAWLIYGALLAACRIAPLRGRRQVALSLAGFAIVALSALIVNLCFHTFHQFI